MKKGCLTLVAVLAVLLIVSLGITLFNKKVPLMNRVALVRIEGPILDPDEKVQEIKEHAKDDSVKAIVMRIDSPGGAVAPSQEIHDEVKKAAARKHIVVSMGSIAASGGYYIAAPASKILANPGTLTGSIGVIMEIPNIEGLMKKVGVTAQVVKSGKHKDIASAFRPLGDEERALLQNVMDNVHEQFIRAVAEGRQLEIEEVRKIADGRIFTGEQAKLQGLIDELGTLQDAIAAAASLAGISGEPDVVEKEDRFSVLDLIRKTFDSKVTGFRAPLQIKYFFAP